MTEWGFNSHVEGERRMIRTEGVNGDIEIGLVWLSKGVETCAKDDAIIACRWRGIHQTSSQFGHFMKAGVTLTQQPQWNCKSIQVLSERV